MKTYAPRLQRHITDINYVRAARAIGHTDKQIQQAMPHNPGFVLYLNRNNWI
jgi:hypothetical protein